MRIFNFHFSNSLLSKISLNKHHHTITNPIVINNKIIHEYSVNYVNASKWYEMFRYKTSNVVRPLSRGYKSTRERIGLGTKRNVPDFEN